jgi:hypothetical protein
MIQGIKYSLFMQRSSGIVHGSEPVNDGDVRFYLDVEDEYEIAK